MRISSSATQNGVLRSGCFKIPPHPPQKSQFNHCQTVLLFQWFTYVHSCITANTLQDSDSQENHNELYNYSLVNKFLVVNRVNVFAIYLLVIERCFCTI